MRISLPTAIVGCIAAAALAIVGAAYLPGPILRQAASLLAVYFVIWWIVLFVVLPFGVRSQVEAGDVAKGTEPGAPVSPGMGRKVLWTTLISALVFAIAYPLIPYILPD